MQRGNLSETVQELRVETLRSVHAEAQMPIQVVRDGWSRKHIVKSTPQLLEVVTNRPEILPLQRIVFDVYFVTRLSECHKVEVFWRCRWMTASPGSFPDVTNEG